MISKNYKKGKKTNNNIIVVKNQIKNKNMKMQSNNYNYKIR